MRGVAADLGTRKLMDDRLQRLKDEARRLTSHQRLELVEDLLCNPDNFSGSFADEWAEEAKDRLAAFRSGELDTVPLADVVDRTARS